MYNVRAYSKKSEGNIYIAKNFRVREFACEDGSDIVIICRELVDTLQKVRNYFGAPVTITSGYRTVSHNKKVGGSEDSKHMYGVAADFVVKGVKAEKVADYLETLVPYSCGIGVYKKENFVHLDWRPNKSRWNG